jgi:hypothetical protein
LPPQKIIEDHQKFKSLKKLQGLNLIQLNIIKSNKKLGKDLKILQNSTLKKV